MPRALLALSLALIFFGREYYVITGKLFNPGDKKSLDHSGYDFGLVVVASLLAQLWTGAAASRLAEPQNQARSVGLITQLDISRCTPRLAFVHSRWASGSGRGVSIFFISSIAETAGHGVQIRQLCEISAVNCYPGPGHGHKNFSLDPRLPTTIADMRNDWNAVCQSCSRFKKNQIKLCWERTFFFAKHLQRLTEGMENILTLQFIY
jgi:hypothetical protein